MTHVFVRQNTALVESTIQNLRTGCVESKLGKRIKDLLVTVRSKNEEKQSDSQSVKSDATDKIIWKNAAVLVPVLIDSSGELNVLLTVRKPGVSIYPYEVSLPGGKVDEQDMCVVETALRESEEEIGLDRRNVEIIASFPSLRVTKQRKYNIYPILGVIRNSFYARLNPDEVLDIFHVPFKQFLAEPDYSGSSKVPYVAAKGMVTNIPVKVYGATFATVTFCAVTIYDTLPHPQAQDFLKFMIKDSSVKSSKHSNSKSIKSKL